MVLSLGDAVRLANDSSLNAFRNRNLYASGYWEWRTFKANRLPGMSLELTLPNITATSQRAMIRSRMSMCSAVSRCTQPQPG